jgi:hypothetical protein
MLGPPNREPFFPKSGQRKRAHSWKLSRMRDVGHQNGVIWWASHVEILSLLSVKSIWNYREEEGERTPPYAELIEHNYNQVSHHPVTPCFWNQM